MNIAPEDDGHIKVMAGIGFVCIQWSLLEHAVLAVISALEGAALEKVYIMFGGLDMKPRLDMAINLARHDRVPNFLVTRLTAIRTSLKQEDLSGRRNQAVHGVHADGPDPDSTTITMVRWWPPKRTAVISALDLHQLGTRLHDLSSEAFAIHNEIHEWKIRVLEKRAEHARREFAKANTPVFLKIAKNLYASAQNRWRKPWK